MAGLVMGFDFGTRKIGIAVGQTITRTANELAIIRARDGKPDWTELDKLVREWQPGKFVVGLPLNMDATMSEMGEAAQKFARRLEGRYGIKAEMMDERLSTFEAREFADTDEDEVDGIAARLILETWLKKET